MLFALYSKLCNAQNGVILAKWSMFWDYTFRHCI